LSPLEIYLNFDTVDSNLLFQQGNQLISPRVVETISLEAPFDSFSYFGDIESTMQIQSPLSITSIAVQGEDKVDIIEGSKIP
jgi:predicted polyphosphate/ATP-dependent NAD kinase